MADKIEKTVTALKIYDTDCHPNDYLFQDPDYREQDQARLDAWKRDEWHFVGVRVQVVVHNWTTGVRAVYESAGLWGIESDCDPAYFDEIAGEELKTLQREYPDVLGVLTLDSTGSVNWKEEY